MAARCAPALASAPGRPRRCAPPVPPTGAWSAPIPVRGAPPARPLHPAEAVPARASAGATAPAHGRAPAAAAVLGPGPAPVSGSDPHRASGRVRGPVPHHQPVRAGAPGHALAAMGRMFPEPVGPAMPLARSCSLAARRVRGAETRHEREAEPAPPEAAAPFGSADTDSDRRQCARQAGPPRAVASATTSATGEALWRGRAAPAPQVRCVDCSPPPAAAPARAAQEPRGPGAAAREPAASVPAAAPGERSVPLSLARERPCLCPARDRRAPVRPRPPPAQETGGGLRPAREWWETNGP
jgi:hypothetical protein